jgi:hypothetical protein
MGEEDPTVERCKHVKSQANTGVFQARQATAVSTYVQQMWGIIGHVTVKAGSPVGTDGAPPQVPPKLCGGRLRGLESVRRSGGAKRAAGRRRSSCWWRCRR